MSNMHEGEAGSAYSVARRQLPEDTQLYVKQGSYELYLSRKQQEFIIGISNRYAEPLHLLKKSIEKIMEDLSDPQLNLLRPFIIEENHFSPENQARYGKTKGWDVYLLCRKVVIQQTGFSQGLLYMTTADLAQILSKL